MATPVFVDDANRGAVATDVVVPSFSATADDVLFAHVSTSSSTISSTPTGHGTWSQVGSSETAPNSSGLHLFACVVSSTGSAAVTVARATSGVMAVQIYKVPGLDVTSGVSSSYSQVKQANFTASTFTVTFDAPVTETTMGFYGGINTQVLTAENTELDQGWYQYQLRGMAAYNAAGDDTPSATCSFSYGSMIAIELVEAASGVEADATTDALVITEYAATVTADTSASGTTDALVITEYAATVNAETSASATVDGLVITEYNATVSKDKETFATTDGIVFTTYNATISTGIAVDATVDPLVITEYNATVTKDISPTATTDAIVFTTYNATVTTGVSVDASVDALVITEYPATVLKDIGATANVDALVFTTYNATVTTTVPDYLIDGVSSKVISADYGSIKIYGNGENWFTL